MSLQRKLDELDANAEKAFTFLEAFLHTERDYLLQLAKGRMVRGHYEWDDKNLKEWGPQRLLAELAEELADAVVYASERFVKLDDV